jgi:hypothetical protein
MCTLRTEYLHSGHVKGREYLVSRRPLKFNVQAVAGTALPKRPVQPEAAVAKTWAVEPRKMGLIGGSWRRQGSSRKRSRVEILVAPAKVFRIFRGSVSRFVV